MATNNKPKSKPKKRIFTSSNGMNPALKEQILKKAIEKELIDANDKGVKFGVAAYEVLTLMILFDKFNFSEEDLKRYMNEMGNYSECITGDYVTLADYVKTLREEANFKLTDDQIATIDPSLAGLL